MLQNMNIVMQHISTVILIIIIHESCRESRQLIDQVDLLVKWKRRCVGC